MNIFSYALKKFNTFNDFLANKLSACLSSMNFFWLCVAIDLVELFMMPPKNIQEWCTFIAQTVIQLLALPVLAFVSNKSGVEELKIIKEDLEIDRKEHEFLKKFAYKVCEKLSINKEELEN